MVRYILLLLLFYSTSLAQGTGPFIIAPVVAAGGGTDQVGYTGSDASSVRAPDYIYYQKVTTNHAGTLQRYKIYFGVDAGSNTVLCALYTNSSGSPGSLVANSTSNTVVGADPGWITFTVSSPPSLSASTIYWIAATQNGTVTAYRQAGSSGANTCAYQAYTYTGSFPASATVDSWVDNAGGIYMEVDY